MSRIFSLFSLSLYVFSPFRSPFFLLSLSLCPSRSPSPLLSFSPFLFVLLSLPHSFMSFRFSLAVPIPLFRSRLIFLSLFFVFDAILLFPDISLSFFYLHCILYKYFNYLKQYAVCINFYKPLLWPQNTRKNTRKNCTSYWWNLFDNTVASF